MLWSCVAVAGTTVADGTWQEADQPAEAGSAITTSQVTKGTGALVEVIGELTATDLEDVLLIRVTDPLHFNVTVSSVSGSLSARLTLLDFTGKGVLSVSGPTPTPTLGPQSNDGSDAIVQAGLYYLAVSGTDRVPLSKSGLIFDEATLGELSGADGPGGSLPLGGWSSTGPATYGSYELQLAGVRFGDLDLCPNDIQGDGVVDSEDLVEVTLAWGQPNSPADVTGDGVVDVQDMVQVVTNWGQCPLAEGSTCPSEGDCFTPRVTSGCDDAACCATICASDPFCCDAHWDSQCVQSALAICTGAVCPGVGSCIESHETPGCHCLSCCQLICADDAFCCEGEWDQICADAASRRCSCDETVAQAFTCPGSETCLLPHDSPGCDDETCCQSVCDLDDYCCTTAWDPACVENAVKLCTRPCAVTCRKQDGIESESCGQNTNGGCLLEEPVFELIECGRSVCGTVWSEDNYRDTDWYLLETDAACTTISVRLESELAGVVYIVGGVESCDLELLGQRGHAAACESLVTAEVSVGPGSYVVFVSTAGFDGFPCGIANDYRLTVACGAVSTERCD